MNNESKWCYMSVPGWTLPQVSQVFLTYVQIISPVADSQLICYKGWAQVQERQYAVALHKHLFEDVRSLEGWRFDGVTGQALILSENWLRK